MVGPVPKIASYKVIYLHFNSKSFSIALLFVGINTKQLNVTQHKSIQDKNKNVQIVSSNQRNPQKCSEQITIVRKS